MPHETRVTLTLNSASLFEALREELGEWKLSDHTFNPDVDEVIVSYDSGGSGRVGLTIGFELDAAQMARFLDAAKPSK
jgi:hypothetical protein